MDINLVKDALIIERYYLDSAPEPCCDEMSDTLTYPGCKWFPGRLQLRIGNANKLTSFCPFCGAKFKTNIIEGNTEVRIE